MHVPPLAMEIARKVAEAGGRAYLVGGCVRDHLLGLPPKDIDIEVHGLDDLYALLQPLGTVNEVGRSFGVFKLTRGDLELDVAIPRRDSKVGPGHRGIEVRGDPHMGLEAAVRRRDLSINSLLYDPLTDEIIDLAGGLSDLDAKVLREVDAASFAEDPLRALRVVQFAARFGFDVAPSLQRICRDAQLDELPPERIRGELDKLLSVSPRPSVGLRWFGELGLAAKVLPALAPDEALGEVLDRAASMERSPQLMYGALLHRLGPAAWEDSLQRLRLFERSAPRGRLAAGLAFTRSGRTASAWRRLADTTPAALAAQLRAAILAEDLDELRAEAEAAGVLEGPLPVLLRGHDLRALGVVPGPRMGALQRRLRGAQHEGVVDDVEEAKELVRGWIAAGDEPC